jgi:uncharacterized iron-regulated membrane protein
MTDLPYSGVQSPEKIGRLYRMLWRWHFYAGLFCIPFIIILSLTGATYLFKPQIEGVLDAPYTNLVLDMQSQPVSSQVQSALNSVEGSRFKSYRLPQEADDAAQITITKDGLDFLTYVHPSSLEVMKTIRTDDRFMSVVAKVHSELLMGDNGSLIVELAASWALVMVATGLYLWWPRQSNGFAGIIYPRLRRGSQIFWRDIHAVTGVWVSGFAIILLISGLPWTNVWGDAFKAIRVATGTAPIIQDWSQGRSRDHADMGDRTQSDHVGHEVGNPIYTANLDDIVASARASQLQPPVVVFPPDAKNKDWRAISQTQNRPLGATVKFDAVDGAFLGKQVFGDKHPIDQAIGIGIALHEGQLLGPLNQAIGLLTAFGLMLLSVSAFVMWRKRAPNGVLGAPPPLPNQRIGFGLCILIIGFGVFLPVMGASLLLIALLERFILVRIPAVRIWLGLVVLHTSKEVA